MANSRIKKCHSAPNALLTNLFYKYGAFIGRHPYPFIIIPPVMACIFAVGMIYRDELIQKDINYLYAPISSNYIEERDKILSVWPMDPNHFTPFSIMNVTQITQAYLHVREDFNTTKNMLTATNIREAINFNDHVTTKLYVVATLPTEDGVVSERNVTFKDVCLRFNGVCSGSNEHLSSLESLIKLGLTDKLTYPTTKISKWLPSVFVAAGLGGVTITDQSVLEFVRSIAVTYYLRHDTAYENATSIWERAYSDYIETYNKNKWNHLKVLYTTSGALIEGMEANAAAVKPRFAITFAVIVVFVVICSFRMKLVDNQKWPKIDTVQSRPLLAIVGVLTAALGIVSAQGILLLAGFDYCSVVEAVPFLVLSIGVDDMFILTAGWRATNPSQSVEERISQTVGQSGTSITITSLTNIVSFAVGMITPLRAIQIFCVHMALALTFDYIFQITFFIGFMTISGRWEAEGRDSICLCKKITIEDHSDESKDIVHKFVESVYCPLVSSRVTQAVTFGFITLYLVFAIWGATNLEEGLETNKLMLRNHHAYMFHEYRIKYFMPQGMQVEVMVQNIPDLSITNNRLKMEEIVGSFEDLQFTMDKEATQFWMRDYLAYNPLAGNVSRAWTYDLYKWVHRRSIAKIYSQALKWKNSTSIDTKSGCGCEDTGVVDAFRFKIALKNFQSTNNQKQAVTVLRTIAKRYPQYNVTTYMGEYPFLDQYLIILPITIKNIGIAITCMIVICLTFIPNPVCVFLIVLTILSIDIGVIGYMTWWNVRLDGVSMISIIMSIGFSVDFSAHITYGFTSAQGSSRQRLEESIKHLGLAVLQGGMSTILGVLVLSTVDSFMVQTFFKTVFLVILFGIIHACIFLPVMLVVSYDFIARSKHDTQILSNRHSKGTQQIEKFHYRSRKKLLT